MVPPRYSGLSMQDLVTLSLPSSSLPKPEVKESRVRSDTFLGEASVYFIKIHFHWIIRMVHTRRKPSIQCQPVAETENPKYHPVLDFLRGSNSS